MQLVATKVVSSTTKGRITVTTSRRVRGPLATKGEEVAHRLGSLLVCGVNEPTSIETGRESPSVADLPPHQRGAGKDANGRLTPLPGGEADRDGEDASKDGLNDRKLLG